MDNLFDIEMEKNQPRCFMDEGYLNEYHPVYLYTNC